MGRMSDQSTEAPRSEPPSSEPPPASDPVWPGPFSTLRRSDDDRWVAGVAGGLARRFDVQPWVVRLAFVLGTFVGVAIPIYAVAWMTLPSDSAPSFARQQGWSRNTVIGASIVLALALTLGVGAGPGGWAWGWGWGWLFPWGVIALGVWFLFRDRWAPPAAPPVQDPRGPVRATSPGAVAPPPPPGSAPPPPPGSAPVPPPGEAAALAAAGRPPLTPPAVPAPAPQRPRPFLTPLALFLAAVVAGACIAVGGRWDGVAVIASLGLLVAGATLVVSAFAGRARGLISLGLLVAIPLVLGLLGSRAWSEWSRGDSDRIVRPETAAELEALDNWGVGSTSLDLSGTRLREDGTTRASVSQSFGELVIDLPRDATVDLDALVAIGEVRIEGSLHDDTHVRSGVDNDLERRIVTGDGSRHLALSAHLFVGRIVVVVTDDRPEPPTSELPRRAPATTTTSTPGGTATEEVPDGPR